MLLYKLIDALRTRLEAALPPEVVVSTVLPAVAADLPVVVLSVADAEPLGAGIGGKPLGLVTGALAVQSRIDLADPVLRFDDDAVVLLSADRRVLQLPHSPLVDPDGGDVGPLAPGAVVLTLGANTFTLVDAAPAAGQVMVDRDTGIATFGAPLALAGLLNAGYFIGQWESDTVRFVATVAADVVAVGADALDALSRQLSETMARHGIAGLSQWAPQSFSAMSAAVPPGGTALRRTLAWRCRFEYDEPRIVTGGGPIRSIVVTAFPHPGAAAPETFTVTRTSP